MTMMELMTMVNSKQPLNMTFKWLIIDFIEDEDDNGNGIDDEDEDEDADGIPNGGLL